MAELEALKIKAVNRESNKPSSKQPEWEAKGVCNDQKGERRGRGKKKRKGSGNKRKTKKPTRKVKAKLVKCHEIVGPGLTMVWNILLTICCDRSLIFVTNCQQLLLVDHALGSRIFHVKFMDVSHHDGIHRAGLFTKPAVNTLEQIDVVE